MTLDKIARDDFAFSHGIAPRTADQTEALAAMNVDAATLAYAIDEAACALERNVDAIATMTSKEASAAMGHLDDLSQQIDDLREALMSQAIAFTMAGSLVAA